MQKFKVESQVGKARTGRLTTAHGAVKMPFFMPVATKGSVKLLSNEEVLSTGTECMISNAFVLSLKPGLKVVEEHGGLHEFMAWKKSLFTDSGGFQVLSPEFCLGLTDEGVLFRNPFDGKKMMFSPEEAMMVQNTLSSDVAMCLDDVPLAGSNEARVKEAVERTTKWAKRCVEAHKNKKQLLFGICQGGTDKTLREKSSREIAALEFDGYAIGGLSIGEAKGKMFEAVKTALSVFPQDKPRYLMGVGSLPELAKAVELGIDVFDSAFPTRTARHGMAYSWNGNINIDNAKFRNDKSPLDKNCECFVCKTHSRAYISHLVRTKEENGLKYLSYHNLFFLQAAIAQMRKQIENGSFSAEKFLARV